MTHPRIRTLRFAASCALLLGCVPLRASTETVELLDALAQVAPGKTLPIIVAYRGRESSYSLRRELKAEERATRRREIVARLRRAADDDTAPLVEAVRAGGGMRLRPLWIANAIALDATPDLVRSLAADPRVLQVRLDRSVMAPLPMAGLTAPVEWNLAMIHAPQAWERGVLGRGAVIAVLDTGVDATHPDLAATWRGGTNSWFDPFGEHAAPRDVSGHGTQAAGLIVGGSAGGSAIGVAPQANWIAARVFDDSGSGTESAAHQAFQWVLDPDGNPATDDAPQVVSASWSIDDGGECNTTFQPDIEALRAADIAVVFAAGNYGPQASSSASPANNGHVQSVGAVDADGNVALYSARGPSACDGTLFPKLAAPGDNVLTSDLSFGGNPYYILVSGTSFSAPHVAGVIALLRAAEPLATVDDVETALRLSARDLGTAGPDPDTGYGLVDAAAALDQLGRGLDADADGFTASRDCNDTNAAVHPGATELRGDGIDQDCNGYDLTIRVHFAVYSHDGRSLRVRASSALRAQAALEIEGVGRLQWREPYGDWIYAGSAGEVRERLVINGLEGRIETTVRRPTRRRESTGGTP
jgi:bacillopeptidase F